MASGDGSAIEALIFQSMNDEPELTPVYDKLIYERNAQMSSRIEEFLKAKNRTFVVVGAGHLVGKGASSIFFGRRATLSNRCKPQAGPGASKPTDSLFPLLPFLLFPHALYAWGETGIGSSPMWRSAYWASRRAKRSGC